MSKVYARTGTLLEAELHEEIVALDPVGGRCFGFNEAAAAVWRLLAEPRSIDQLTAALIEEFDVAPDQCRSDLDELLEQLTDLGLVRPLP